ncbi:hypothetical protein AAZX31_11G214700 [Glycine max]|uniref:Cysteine-rich receptor-like protein kinase 2 n=2 Tax=Glycine subgen. Soja TaxID=1462606 RepID=K7LRD6_SOYBN|nr:cysteine-rich receptor-like protein kinase 2 [Glycine max]XP_028186262.1 cysteine-rich receptor-like protein kinase 2 [Glycine soja]KAG5125182.1 hypothetical protein JHK82_031919 [Glycine max]KAG5146606.1 hypothetical protein JHK84_032149 [Glycine max]KAH1160114.1 hypothetical protein GYH30_031743 [Glycine max]KAH1226367.1 Cysteine-rich receptor-like protein kinase 2 [Glycine max]KRH30803.1 hypothetical protein GLYMA_11G207300v4 [Glycine max]|eukprot:XP_006591291.1 cysteine-rich receptor-like protein kinase 2 [Glycine max]
MVKLFKVVALTLLVLWSWWSFEGAVGDPQLFLLTNECSGFTTANFDLSTFFQNLNASFADLREQVTNQSKQFAIAQSTSGTSPVYAMFQCMNYLSIADCAACLAAADTEIRNCSTGTTDGARVVYDGCFLRYENNNFYEDTTLPGNSMRCGNQTAVETTTFSTTVQQVLMDLRIATPKISRYFATTKTQVAGIAIYAVAQCAETFTRDTCSSCLSIQQSNIQGCLPNTNGRAIDPAGCFMRYSQTPFFADNQTTDISPFLNKGGSSSKKWVIFGGGVGGVILAVILLSLFRWYRRSNSPKRVPRAYTLGATELKAATKYKYSDLKAATKNFSERNKLGEGGFGAVYKGTMKNGKVVAVKLLSAKSSKIDDDFEREVTLISNVHHKNLVQLLGCCVKGQDRILVYEYMANNSLEKFLFGIRKNSLNWRQRYDIILGTARGLAYLHEEFHVSIIHRDIKSGNILLDEELQPKIADFGLVKLLPGDQSHLSTRFAGTLGYTAPEYALHGQLSEKADTYSYGIVVLEIISGRKSTDVNAVNDDSEDDYLLRQAWKLYESGKHLELVDKSLNPYKYDAEEVKKVMGIALLCTQASAAMRPAMSEVVILLSSNDLLEHMRPSMPIFFESNLKPRNDISASTSSSMTNTTTSNSIIPAR